MDIVLTPCYHTTRHWRLRSAMRNAKAKPPPKATKVQLRLRPAEKALLARAAAVRRTTLTSFLLEHAFQAAQQVLADQVHFTLPPGRWKAFCEALDAPPREIPALAQLLQQASRLDGPCNPPAP
jgi:uncharacterized protein (DUF1778 family)